MQLKDQKKAVEAEQKVQPWYVLVFVSSVIAILATIVFFFPEKGWEPVAGVKLYFPTWNHFFQADTNQAPDLATILANLEAEIDTTEVDSSGNEDDTIPDFKKGPKGKPGPNVIQYPDNDPSVIYPAFAAMESAQKNKKLIRVMHYGDSQLEGDRMTSLFRARIQEKFGGTGPGLVAAKPLVSSMSIRQEQSESMLRFTQYGKRDTSVHHNRYGAMAIFSRFSPIVPDSLINDEELKTGWFSFMKSSSGYGGTRIYNQVRMFYGFNRREVSVKVFADDVLFADEKLPAGTSLKVKKWKFKETPNKLMIIMEGADSPDIYGLSLESTEGVAVDNISMRGGSGTSFGALDYVPFKPMLDSLHPKLLLLQYGGNTVPYIKDDKAAQGYGAQFKRQIDYLKKQIPGVSIIVIGPGDMSTKVDGEMQSYPNLVAVRDALKKAAFDAGAGFFDIYEAMGGHNSMIEWAEAEPALAAPDYVHFAPGGARIIAEAFIKSLMADYATYRKAQTQ